MISSALHLLGADDEPAGLCAARELVGDIASGEAVRRGSCTGEAAALVLEGAFIGLPASCACWRRAHVAGDIGIWVRVRDVMCVVGDCGWPCPRPTLGLLRVKVAAGHLRGLMRPA
mmetsp:Transcript_19655/g.45809  ORF Transcript_19655/g.45809 Transcript_19655/m.45809 type:complete len:116 (+) Transcript_19655:825-1172(+)